MDLFPLARGRVSTNQNVGEGLAVVAVVVVEEKLGFRQNVCFSCNLIAGVECALRPWDFVAKENCKMKMKVNKRLYVGIKDLPKSSGLITRASETFSIVAVITPFKAEAFET